MIISYCPARNTHNIIRNGSGNSSNSSRVCTFVPIPPGAMVLHRTSWVDEQALYYEKELQIGADNSLICDHEQVFVIRPDDLFGKIEYVDYFHGVLNHFVVGHMVDDERHFNSIDVISTLRGPVKIALIKVQRAFRRKRYVKWYAQTVWNIFVTDVVDWIESKGRYFRKRKHDPFGESVARTWGYVPAPAVAEWRAVIVPAMGAGRRATTN